MLIMTEFQAYNSFVQTCLGWGSEKKVEASRRKGILER